MKLSIRKKLTFFYIITVFVILVIFDLFIYFSFQKSVEKNIEKSLVNSCQILVGDTFKQNLSGETIEQDKEYKEEISIISQIFEEDFNELVRPAGFCGQLMDVKKPDSPEILYRTSNFPELEIPTNQDLIEITIANKSTSKRYYFFNSEDAKMINFYFYDFLDNHFIVQIAEPLANSLKSQRRIKTTLLFFSPIFLLLLSLTGFILIKKAFAPIKNIVSEVNLITAKDLSRRIETGSKDEIGELVSTFNDLISRLESSFNQIRQFSLDVSHELKTPLTILKGEIEVVLRKEREPEEYRKSIGSLGEEIEKLRKIIDNLLLLSNLDAHEQKLQFANIDLNDVILEVFDDLLELAKAKKQALELKNITSQKIKGEKELLKRLFSNLLENAIKYTPEKGKIMIEMGTKDKQVKVSITDNGIGIKPDFQEKIFDRFFRIDEARTTESKSSGLGLAISQKIAKIHKTEIKVKSELGKGSCFSASFKN
ncbi:MAG: HAMP domain-containing protein [Candidatus Cloacimonetes bacterium]|nr:HAMP domain-containing protein [Candidatus Cloacimonadota bacterium]